MHLQNTAALMARKMRADEFDSYAVLVGINGEESLLTSPDVNEDTYFDIASMGKVLVTSTLALKAVGIGKLTLAATLADFFPHTPDDKRAITLHQLLTHTSGIVRDSIPAYVAAAGSEAIARHILGNPLAYKPGTNYVYSCHGFILMGFILEKVFGDTLDEVFYTHLRNPLHLTRSRFNIATDEPDAAPCYTRAEIGMLRVDDDNVYKMGGIAGSGASFWTLADLRTYVRAALAKSEALYRHDLFDQAEVNYTPDFSEGRGLGYLIVDMKYKQAGALFPLGSFGHCGHTGTSFFMNRERDLYAIVLTNATRFLKMKSGFTTYDYEAIKTMRADIHTAIARDLNDQNVLDRTI